MAKEQISLSDMLQSFTESIQVKSSDTYVPHQAQIEYHQSKAKEKIFIGGNRAGKTVASVLEAIFRVTKTHPFRPELNEIKEPIRGRYVAVSIEEGLNQIILPMFKEWIPRRFLINSSWEESYHTKSRKLTLKDGSFIEFMTYEQETEKFAGTSRHFTGFDEEPPELIWQECIMRLLDTDGDWWIAMTPVEGVTWTYTQIVEPYKEGQRPWTLVQWVNTTANPHIKLEAYERTMANFNDEDRAARSEGNYNQEKGLIYKKFDDSIHILREPFHVRNGNGWYIYTSLDSGWRHPAAWLWHAVHESGRIVTFHEIVLSETTVEDFAKKVHKFESDNGINVHFRTGDPALLQTREHVGTSVLQEYAKHGIYLNVDGVPRGPNARDNGINKVTTYLNGRVKFYDDSGNVVTYPMYQVHENCPHLIKEFKKYRWAKHVSRKVEKTKAPKPEPEKKDDDALDSLRYFVTTMDDLTPSKLETLEKEVYYFQGKKVIEYDPYEDYARPREDLATIHYSEESWF